MRCLALAQALKEVGGEPALVTAAPAPSLEQRWQDAGMEVIFLGEAPGSREDARRTIELAQLRGAGWLVADGYHFGADYQHIIKDFGLRLLCIDDYGHADHYYADFILNQNASAHEALYPSVPSNTRLLLGTKYVLLREEFLRWQGWKRQPPETPRRILVTLGGSDPDNATAKVIKALGLLEIEGLEARVVVGGSNPHGHELRRLAANLGDAMQIDSNVADMAPLMAWADVAITGSGTTCWEAAFMGLPCLLIILAENQRLIAERLDELEVAVSLGWQDKLTPLRIAEGIEGLQSLPGVLREMSQKGQNLVDGQGSGRVIEAIEMSEGFQ
jgi:UDP-2,4-diacetamido-2,4,6-trideoxy-beta-L-altropyranose hydrolase